VTLHSQHLKSSTKPLIVSLYGQGNGMPIDDVLVLSMSVMQVNDNKPVNVVFSLRSQCGWIEIARPSQTFDLRIDVTSKTRPQQFYLKLELREYFADSQNFIVEESILLLHTVTKIPKTWLKIYLAPPGSVAMDQLSSLMSDSDDSPYSLKSDLEEIPYPL
jgi:hypothetical protein